MRVLVSPLDWGLGHAARLIPIIRCLRKNGVAVLLAGHGRSLDLLVKEFPDLPSIVLRGFTARYPRRVPMALAMLARFPAVVAGALREHRGLQEIVRDEGIDAVVSDGRFGLFSSTIPSVYVTHQLTIAAPSPFRFTEPLMRLMHRKLIGKYSECWIPDEENEGNLAGDLSRGGRKPANVYYVGWLSRFTDREEVEPRCEIAAILSGPEPQRTRLEEVLLPQLTALGSRAVLVRGVTEDRSRQQMGCVEIVSHMESRELQSLLTSSAVIISRPGYSTVMDLARLGGRALFIPTPGQTEQEYLGRRLMELGIAYCTTQQGFDLGRALHESSRFRGFAPTPAGKEVDEAVLRLIERIRRGRV